MPTYFSPDGNAEVWDKKPDGYCTIVEWQAAHPDPVIDANEADGVKAEILALESQQTPRRLREAALTDEGRAWLQGLEDQIEELRVKLAELE